MPFVKNKNLKFMEVTIMRIGIRSVTDTETHSGSEHFEENCEKASVIAKDITVALLAELCNR